MPTKRTKGGAGARDRGAARGAAKGAARGSGKGSARGRKVSARPAKVAPVPPQYGSVTPYLVVRGAEEALEFYGKAFGARTLMRMPGPDGKLMHAEMKIGDSVVMLGDENPERGAKSPQTLGGSAGSVMLYVKDCDRVHEQAVAAGAKSLDAPQDMFWGDRYGKIEDPFGHQWGIATAKENVPPRELKRRMAAMGQG